MGYFGGLKSFVLKFGELGYKLEQIKQLIGMDIKRLATPLKKVKTSKGERQCTRWQDYITYKEACLKQKVMQYE